MYIDSQRMLTKDLWVLTHSIIRKAHPTTGACTTQSVLSLPKINIHFEALSSSLMERFSSKEHIGLFHCSDCAAASGSVWK